MPTRDHPPAGAPCWADLWTSDVEAVRAFYPGLFGWEAAEPSAEFGGYFMFLRAGVPVAGAMGPMGDQPGDDTWKLYLAAEDIEQAAAAAEAAGAELTSPPMAVGDVGTQCVLVDPAGATLGLWQPGTFPGFTVLAEVGAPAWFELEARDHAGALAFYQAVFGWEPDPITAGGEAAAPYSILHGSAGPEPLAGITDAGASLPGGVSARWSIYFAVEDAAAACKRVRSLGGSVVREPEGSSYGTSATVRDPAGGELRLHAPAR